MMNDQTDEIIELLESLKNRYQKNLESMRYNGFVFDYVHLLYYQCHKINLNCGRSYRFSWLGKKQKSNNITYQ